MYNNIYIYTSNNFLFSCRSKINHANPDKNMRLFLRMLLLWTVHHAHICANHMYTVLAFAVHMYTRMAYAYAPISTYALCSHPICLCNACKQAVCMYSMSQACFYTIRQYVVHKYAHALYIHYTQTRPKHTRTLHSWSQVSAQQNEPIKLWTETMGWFTKYWQPPWCSATRVGWWTRGCES
jgi:hypothetical protein